MTRKLLMVTNLRQFLLRRNFETSPPSEFRGPELAKVPVAVEKLLISKSLQSGRQAPVAIRHTQPHSLFR